MKNLESVFEKLYNPATVAASFESLNFAQDSHLTTKAYPQQEYEIQKIIRPLFGKSGLNTESLGAPPTLRDLIEPENHYIATLFIDIKGSTRLSLLHSLDEVYRFKNAVIQTAIEAVRSLDGQVHRIMGDAVMAFFGGKNIEPENAVADAINCTLILRSILENAIKPWMLSNGWDSKDIGFRVGLDFGRDEEVLWAAYGYTGNHEITATGLPVDMASKLQGLASKNEIMLGEGVLNFIDWPTEYSKIKKKIKNDEEIDVLYVTPNLTNRDGLSLNYEMKILDYDKLLRLSPLPLEWKEELTTGCVKNKNITLKCYWGAGKYATVNRYHSSSKFLEKNIDLKFEVIANANALYFPLTVKMTKTNHGKEARESGEEKTYKPEIQQIFAQKRNLYGNLPDTAPHVVFFEQTAYRGLHTMFCEVTDNRGDLVFRDAIGVFIK